MVGFGLPGASIAIRHPSAQRHARAFCKEMIRSHSIPLSLGRGEEPNEESLEAIRETEEFFASGKRGRFTNAHDLIEAALA